MERYHDKPLLRFLDGYVLDSIGKLGDEERARLEGLEPLLWETFGTRSPWKEVLEQQLQFPSTFQAQIRLAWERCQSASRSAGHDLDPFEFMIGFINANFPSINDAAPLD